jgi:hypothetical protein
VPLDGTNYVIPENRVTECLIRASTRIQNPRDWCQKTGVDGNRRCAFVALSNCRFDHSQMATAKAILDRVAKDRGYTGIMHLNDSTNHATVMSAFREAIEIARADA